MASSNEKKYDRIRVDAGASENFVNNIKYFRMLKDVKKVELCMTYNTVMYASHKGTVEGESQLATLVMTNVFFVSTL